MAWIIKSACDGPIVISDLNMTFSKDQVRDVDLFGGRDNVERSNDLKILITKGYLKELKKDKIFLDLPARVEENLNQINETVQNISTTTTESIKKLEDRLTEQGQKLAEQNQKISSNNTEMVDLVQKVLNEVKAFALNHPIQIETIAQAMKNIKVERATIAERREEISERNEENMDAEIMLQEKLLKLKDKKLEKNLGDLGKSVSATAGEDFEASLAALDAIGIPEK